MKKHLFFAVLFVAVAMIAAGTAMAGVIGTAHDLRSVTNATGPGLSTTTSEVCVYCHTPHGASTVITTLLWNKADVTTATYTPYSNPGSIVGTIDSTLGTQTRICLSCHDGSNSIFNMVNSPNSGGYATGVTTGSGNITGGGLITGTPRLTQDFSNDHPISIQWPTRVGIAATSPYPLFGSPLKMECGTCHSVHDNTVGQPFLRASNAASALCIACHTNK